LVPETPGREYNERVEEDQPDILARFVVAVVVVVAVAGVVAGVVVVI